MCIRPVTLDNGTQVACRNCWQCLASKKDDWIGRCIAESKTVKATFALTLTYGRDLTDDSSETYGEAEHPRAAVLTYSDVQKFLKLIRRRGYEVRYFVTGEMGSLKGRAHWHIILFFLNEVPVFPVYGKRFHWEYTDEHGEVKLFWPHGFVHVEKPGYAAFRYNMKYILKDIQDDRAQSIYKMSRMPPLGSEYFARLADRTAKQGLPLVDLSYTLPNVVRHLTGQSIKFYLHGRSAELYVEAYKAAWRKYKGNDNWPITDVTSEEFEFERDSLSIQAEYIPRPSNPHDADVSSTRTYSGGVWSYARNLGQAALKARGITDPVGVYKQRKDGTYYYTERDGTVLIWGVMPSGGMSWRNLKAESVILRTRKSLSERLLPDQVEVRIGRKRLRLRRQG